MVYSRREHRAQHRERCGMNGGSATFRLTSFVNGAWCWGLWDASRSGEVESLGGRMPF